MSLGSGGSLHKAFLGPCYCGWTLNVSIGPSGLRDLTLSFVPLPSPTLSDIILQPLPFSDLPASAYSNAAHHCEPRGSNQRPDLPQDLTSTWSPCLANSTQDFYLPHLM